MNPLRPWRSSLGAAGAAVPAPALYRGAGDVLVLVVGDGRGPSQLTSTVALLSDAEREPVSLLVLDVGRIHRMSSDLLALLLWANLRLQDRGTQLAVACPSTATRDLLTRTGLDHVIRVLEQAPQEVAA